MSVSTLEASTDEVDRLGRSIVEVAPAKSVILLGSSSERLEIIASVVIGDGATSLEIALLKVVASACVSTTTVYSIERLWISLVVVSVGSKVSEVDSSENGVTTGTSVGAATGSSDALIISLITSVRLLSTSEDTVGVCRGASVDVIEGSMVVSRVISLVSVGSSCVGSSVGSSRMLDGDG